MHGKMADEDEEIILFDEVHFISIPSQTNVYGLSKFLDHKSGRSMLLLSSLKGTVMAICSSNKFTPSSLSSSPIPFQNIQENVDIVSMDAFTNSSGVNVAITVVKGSHTDYQKQFIHFYYKNKLEQYSTLECIAENCQAIELDFVPFQLYHTTVFENDVKESEVFLLSGSDYKIHIFAMDGGQFVECNLENHFPEFMNFPSSVIWMDIYHDSANKRRISAVACQNGFLKVVVVDYEHVIQSEWTTTHDGPISSVRIFAFTADSHGVSQELHDILPQCDEPNEHSAQSFHVLVTGVIEPAVIYQDVLKCGLSKLTTLPESDKYDCVVCSFITDIDWDGNNEVILGTYGQELLVYKLSAMSDNEGEITFEKLQTKLCWRKNFAQPLFAIDYVDVTEDGACELVVASSKGLHILQHRFPQITKRFQKEFGNQ